MAVAQRGAARGEGTVRFAVRLTCKFLPQLPNTIKMELQDNDGGEQGTRTRESNLQFQSMVRELLCEASRLGADSLCFEGVLGQEVPA